MRNPIGTHIQVWSATWSADDVRRTAEKASDCGYDYLELPVRDPHSLEIEGIAKALQDNNMFCCTPFLHTKETDIGSEDKSIAAKGEALMLDALSAARDMGSKHITGPSHTCLAKHDVMRSGAGRRNAIEVLQRVAERASEMGLSLNFECLNRYESNFSTTCAEALEMIEAIGRDNCFVHLDTFHMNIEEPDPVAAIKRAGDRLGYFHLADNYRGYLGTGSIDFQSIFRALRDVNYEGPIALEVFSSAITNPVHSARLAIWRDTWSDSIDMAQHAMQFIRCQMDTADRRIDAALQTEVAR
ncbi:sugar phosphate isomerase/epimerase family protein [Pseudovibrio exalbescens]|uniref:sugar phosphate isomerase/epimerase family protein n=1 Tax=Pseudovibrio exalbescens TaxID=197461 RepID=UPI000C9B030D|nr:sugar phosphate isomerase/epimerase family protein [Pseudovibrio exalbescens]